MTVRSPDDRITPSESTKARLRYHALAILALSLVMYFLLDFATDEEILDITLLLEMQDEGFDYFMSDVDSARYTATGKMDYRFLASQVTHFPNPEYSIVEQPQFMIFRPDNRLWEITSETGRVDTDPVQNRQRVTLSNNVIITGTNADGRPVNIYTESLTVYPNEKSMNTQSDVLVESDGFSSTSSGFFADMNTNIIRQLANGNFTYDQ